MKRHVWVALSVLVTTVLPASAGTVGYAISGFLEDGATFRGSFHYGVAEDSEPLKCFAIGAGFCRFTLKDWDVTVTGGFYDGVHFLGSGWDAVNNYGQYATRDGFMGQMVSFDDGYGNYLSAYFAGAFTNLRVAAPFQTDSLFAEGSMFGPGLPVPLAPAELMAASAFRVGIAAGTAPDAPVNITGAALVPLPEPAAALTVLPALVGLVALKRLLR